VQSEPVHTLAILPLIAIAIGAILALFLVGGVIALFIRAACRRPALMLPTAVFLCVALLGAGVVSLYHVRSQDAETALREQRKHELQTLAAALHQHQAAQPQDVVAVSSEASVLDFRGDSDETVPAASASDDQSTNAESPSLELVSFVGRDVVGQRLADLPDWINDGTVEDTVNGIRHQVLVSDQWATVEEADAQLTSVAAAELSQYLADEHPQAAGWLPDANAIVQSGAVTRRVHETSTLPIGEFNPPLYRVYWQLELTPAVREQLLESWRPFAVSQRLSWLGAGLGAVILLFAALAAILRFRNALPPRVQPVLSRATVAAVVIAAGAAALLLA
jgi:hypothetical protein